MIGGSYRKSHKYERALEYLNLAVEALPPNHFAFSHCYNAIGHVYQVSKKQFFFIKFIFTIAAFLKIMYCLLLEGNDILS